MPARFELVDPRETAELIMRSVVAFTHPLVVAQCLEEGDDVDAAGAGLGPLPPPRHYPPPVNPCRNSKT